MQRNKTDNIPAIIPNFCFILSFSLKTTRAANIERISPPPFTKGKNMILGITPDKYKLNLLFKATKTPLNIIRNNGRRRRILFLDSALLLPLFLIEKIHQMSEQTNEKTNEMIRNESSSFLCELLWWIFCITPIKPVQKNAIKENTSQRGDTRSFLPEKSTDRTKQITRRTIPAYWNKLRLSSPKNCPHRVGIRVDKEIITVVYEKGPFFNASRFEICCERVRRPNTIAVTTVKTEQDKSSDIMSSTTAETIDTMQL